MLYFIIFIFKRRNLRFKQEIDYMVQAFYKLLTIRVNFSSLFLSYLIYKIHIQLGLVIQEWFQGK